MIGAVRFGVRLQTSCTSSPLGQAPYLRLHRASFDPDFDINRDSLFEMLHRLLGLSGQMMEIGQIIVERGLVVTVALGDTEVESHRRELQCRWQVTGSLAHQG